MIEQLNQSWSESGAEQILAANNHQAPMTLRVNALKCSRDDYLQRLEDVGMTASVTQYSAQGIILDKPVDVVELPGFKQGMVSVQDEAAQLAASLLELAPDQHVLDACCAPGGKTCHILESMSALQSVVAIDLEQQRLKRTDDNLQRLGLKAQVIAADVVIQINGGIKHPLSAFFSMLPVRHQVLFEDIPISNYCANTRILIS